MRKLTSNIWKLALAVIIVCLSGCGKVQDITVTSVEVENIAMQGFRGAQIALAVGVDNPAMQVTLSEIEATLKHSGKILGKVFVDPFTLHGKSAEIYHLKADVKLDTGVTLLDLMALLQEKDLKSYLIDVHVKATLKSGLSSPLNFKDIPLEELM